MSQQNNFTNIFKGMGMGIAEVIPGVSGGTIAFITGIYETLLNSIKSFSPALLGVFKNEGVSGVWKHINGSFLVTLIIGMVLGILGGVLGVTYLLENYPVLLWSFFFGLIIASSIYVGKQVKGWNIGNILMLVLGAVVAYYITIASPAQGSENLLFVFFSGLIAISALMLPGLSGSFILLLLGMYKFILSDTLKTGVLKNQDPQAMLIMGVFGIGCLVGLMTFSRILSWTFKHYRNPTLALLTGFMIGSLNKVWPWQQVLSTRIKSDGEEVIQFSKSVLPSTFSTLQNNLLYGNEPYLIGAIALMFVGFASVFVLERFGEKEAF